MLSHNISIRTDFRPEHDVEAVAQLHDAIYSDGYSFGGAIFSTYVKEGLEEFTNHFSPDRDAVWLCEVEGKLVGSLFLMNRGDKAQLRYFLLRQEVRGLGLGKRLMGLFFEFLQKANYASCYLWTVKGLNEAATLYLKYGFILTEESESTAFGTSVIEQKYEVQLPHVLPAQISDAEELRALSQQTFVDTYTEYNTSENMEMHISTKFTLVQIQKELTDATVKYLLLKKGKQLIGFIKLIKNHAPKELTSEGVVEIERFYVDKAFHGLQLGKFLMNYTLDWCRNMGFATVWLGVWEENARALRFYTKMGFEKIGEHVFVLGTEVQNDYVMALTLKML
ncbi:GNAT family N-acetyltransferase [Runella limosa]|uniref:GNAT family N-acetyltransferase n=1 Tax=Runella limosa TaxID=370978 RepID=UPI0003F629A3|nr:GNAT family N-acetyltransferase [Runella limosa]